MFDIPFDKIFESSENPQSIEFGKRIKLKSGKLGTENGSLTDFKGKLFISLNNHLNQVKLDCPNGKCTYNQTHKTYTLSNLPTYFMVNLQNKNIFNNCALDVLKSLILIPGLFDISTIFEYRNEKKKLFYEFLGGICNNNCKSFTAFFLQQNEWIHYDDDKVIYYKNWYELVIEMVKKQEMPMFLVFQKQENFDEINLSLLNDEILKLERFARNLDNIPQIFLNKFRPFEDISKIDTINVDTIKTSTEQNKYKRVLKSNESSSNLEYYNCSICNFKNRIENVKCLKCEKNNEIVINQLINNLNKRTGNSNPSGDHSVKKSNFTNEMNSTLTNTFAKNTHYESKSKGFYKNDNDSNTNEKHFKDELKDTLKSFDTPEFPEEKIRNSNAQKLVPSFKENNFLSDIKVNKVVMTLCRQCGLIIEKCQCKISSNNEKLNPKIDEKIRKKNSNEWECEQCKYINSNLLTKCKLCKSSNKSNTQQSTTMNTKEVNQNSVNSNIQVANKKVPEEKNKNMIEGNTINHSKNIQITSSKEISNNNSHNKCICHVIDNDSLFTNNICRLCKRTRTEKIIKPLPKKQSNNTIEVKSSREYVTGNANNLPNNISQKSYMVKSGSKEITPVNDVKKLEVKKNNLENNETRNSKNMMIQGKINSNIKTNINKDVSNNEMNNPFKKTYFNQQSNQIPVNNQAVKRSPFKEIEVKNYNNGLNSKNTISKQRYNDYTSQKLK